MVLIFQQIITTLFFSRNHSTDHLPLSSAPLYINYPTAVVYHLPLVQSTHENRKSFFPLICVLSGNQEMCFKYDNDLLQDIAFRGVERERERANENMNTTTLHGGE